VQLTREVLLHGAVPPMLVLGVVGPTVLALGRLLN